MKQPLSIICIALLLPFILGFSPYFGENRNDMSNVPDSIDRAILQDRVSIEQQNLSAAEPTRSGDQASITQDGFTITVQPENLTLQGYYGVSSRGYYQCGEYKITADRSGLLNLFRKKQFDNPNITIFTPRTNRYALAEAFKKEWVTYYGNETVEDTTRQDTVLGNLTTRRTVYSLNATTNESYASGEENVTYWIIENRSKQYTKHEEKAISSLNLSNEQTFYLRICAPKATSDLFDMGFKFDATNILLPAPLFNTSTQTEWNLGSHSNTTANATGLLILNTSLYEINTTRNNFTSLSILFHFNTIAADGESSTSANNYAGAGFNDATCTSPNCATSTNNGKIGKAYDFDNDVFSVADFTEITSVLNKLSFGSWIKPDTELTAAGDRYILRKKSSTNDAYYLRMNAGTDQYRCMVRTSGTNRVCDTALPAGYTTVGAWHNVACAYDGTNLKVYWDGAVNNTCSYSGDVVAGAGDLFIGAYNNNAADPFDGSIDEAFLWRRALSAQEVQDIYEYQDGLYARNSNYQSKVFNDTTNAQWNVIYWSSPYNKSGQIDKENFNTTALQALYHFNKEDRFGENATYAYDHSNNNRHATCTSCPTSTNAGKFLGAYSYAGIQYFNATTTKNLLLENDFTASFWIKFSSLNNDKDIMKKLERPTRNGWQLAYYQAYGTITFEQSCNNIYDLKPADQQISTNTWYHVAYRVTSGTGRMFINGKLQASSSTQEICDTGSAIEIGTSSLASETINGTVDEVAIWSRSLSNEEIAQQYARGLTQAALNARSCNDSQCSGEAYSQNFTESPILLNTSITPDNTYFQYQYALSTSNRSSTPEIKSIVIKNFANESEGRTAIEQGIQQELASGYTLSYSYQVYSRNLSNSQTLGTFDVVAIKANKTWGFNYLAGQQAAVQMGNLTPVLYTFEFFNKTEEEITTEVKKFINTTR